MADCEYKLVHFNVRFLAEPIRWIFSYAGVAFEDVRITVDQWATLKPGLFVSSYLLGPKNKICEK